MPGNLFTLRVPYKTPVVDANYMGTKQWTDFMMSLLTAVQSGSVINVTALGAVGKGGDDTAIFQLAVDTAVNQGGGVVFIPAGSYSITTVTVPVGNTPITFMGQGSSTVINRRGDLAAGAGLFDIFGSNVTFDSLAIDGQTFTPAGLIYLTDFTGPMDAVLTKNTSIWLHGPAYSFLCTRTRIQHSGGYGILIDAQPGGIQDVQISDCTFVNNRPSIFGITAGQANYGSWNGNVYVNGDGTAAHPGCILKHLSVTNCQFLRCTGNTIWSHLYGLQELHEDFVITGNYFLDCGLDAILIGGVSGGSVIGNVGRRIGYITADDTSDSVPQWLPGLNATAIDSGGLVKGVVYCNNSFVSVNGGCLDMDGHCDSCVVGNTFRVPYPDEPEYTEDKIATSGPLNNGSHCYGINTNNSQNTTYGGSNLTFVGNTFVNLPAGAVRLYSARRCFVSGNNIIAPSNPVSPPMEMGPVGTGPNQRCLDNRITGNNIVYNPSAAVPAIFESDIITPFLPSEQNTVCGNVPITPIGTLAVEFQKSPNSGSVVYLETVWFT